MANTILVGTGDGAGIVTTTGTAQYWGIGGALQVKSTEAQQQVWIRSPGTFHHLTVKVSAYAITAGTASVTFRLTGVSKTLAVNTGSVNVFTDAVNVQAVVSGDKVNFITPSCTGTITYSTIAMLFDSTTDYAARQVADSNSAVTYTTGNSYSAFSGRFAGNASNLAGIQTKLPLTCTVKNLFVGIAANAKTSTWTMRSNKGGANGALVLTVPTGANTYTEDTVNADSLVATNLWCTSKIVGTDTTNASTLAQIAVDFITTGGLNKFLLQCQADADVAAVRNATRYMPMSGNYAMNATVGNCYIVANAAFTLSNLGATHTVASGAAQNIYVVQNGSNTAMHIVTGTAANTQESDDVNTLAVISTDSLCFSMVGGSNTTVGSWSKTWCIGYFAPSLTRIQPLQTVKYNLDARIKPTKTTLYNVAARRAVTKTLLYNDRKIVQPQRTLLYSLRKAVRPSQTIKYNLVARLINPKTLKYALLAQIKPTKTLKYQLLKRITTRRLSLQFNGLASPSGNYVEITNPYKGFTNKITIVAWCKISTVENTWAGIIDGINGYRGGTRLLISPTNFYFQVNGVGTSNQSRASYANTWHHFACVYDGANVQLYFDGVAWGSPYAFTTNMNTSTSNTIIGWGSTSIYHYGGNIADLAIYDTNLTNQEIADIKNYGSSVVSHNCISRYKLDENTGSIVYDSAGTRNGTLTNSPTWASEPNLVYSLLARVPEQKTLLYSLNAVIKPTKTIKYNLQARITPQKTIKYSLLAQIKASRTIKYNLLKRLVEVRTLLYNLAIIGLTRIQPIQTIKYDLRMQVPVQRTTRYQLFKIVQPQRIIRYQLLQRVPTITKTIKYALLARLTLAKTAKYNLVARLKTTKTLLYNLASGTLTRIQPLRTVKYNLVARVKPQNTVKYNLVARLKPVTTLKYQLFKFVQPQRTIRYQVFARRQPSKTVKYHLIARLKKPTTLQYQLLKRIVPSQTLRYSLRKAIQSSKTLKYNLAARLILSKTLKYSLVARLKSSSTIKYSLLKRILVGPITLKYSMRRYIIASNTLKYNLLARILITKTILYDLDSMTKYVRLHIGRTIKYNLKNPRFIGKRFRRELNTRFFSRRQQSG